MIVIDALVTALRAKGLAVIEQPQVATNTAPRLELWLSGFTAGGERKGGSPLEYETVIFTADVVASGVARMFVGGLRKILRTMMELGESSLPVSVGVPNPARPEEALTKNLRAHFEKTAPGAFEYETEDAPMPARFKESWRITITYPAGIVPQEEDL
jgi:hypothetical protein